ncbi:Dynamin-related protein 1A [Thelohanellus kitauei]|uniref:Dynamin-related protein 1A n=1 Tax=Thelohanellus kitauei TaxID=669202 RepID=A0A0C2JI25_THEKT|nr:Dynamin-related protein 1A [Thelohanellus kitauei]
MDELIQTINEIMDNLQEAGVTYDFQLPQIVVVGEQSAGKTSVLESFIGSLKIYSPDGNYLNELVLNLTVVDLPGLTKIAVGGQSDNVPENIMNLVLKHISNPNSIILAVIPAIVDLANSEALKLASKVDPYRLKYPKLRLPNHWCANKNRYDGFGNKLQEHFREHKLSSL